MHCGCSYESDSPSKQHFRNPIPFQNRFRYYLCEREYYNPSNCGIIIHITSSTKGGTSSDVRKLRIKVVVPLKLLIVIDEKPIVNVPDRTIERLTTTSKCFLDTTCGSENIVFDRSFCFVDQSNDQIPFTPTHQCCTSGFFYIMRAPTCQPPVNLNLQIIFFRAILESKPISSFQPVVLLSYVSILASMIIRHKYVWLLQDFPRDLHSSSIVLTIFLVDEPFASHYANKYWRRLGGYAPPLDTSLVVKSSFIPFSMNSFSYFFIQPSF